MATGAKHRVVGRPITSICKTSCRYVGKENRMSINPTRNAHAAPRCRGLILISRKRLRTATIDQPLWRDRTLARPPLGARQDRSWGRSTRDAHADGNTNGGVSDRAGNSKKLVFSVGRLAYPCAYRVLECKNERDTHVSPCAGTMHNIGGNAAARRRYRSQRCNEQQGGNEHGDTSRALLLRSCRNQVNGAPEAMGYCHCNACRSWSAAPVNAFTLWKPENVKVTTGAGLVGHFMKTSMSDRQYCTKCGGHLMTNHPPLGMVDVYAADDTECGIHPRPSRQLCRRCCP